MECLVVWAVQQELVNEFVGTAIAGTSGAATAKKGNRVRKAVGSGTGYMMIGGVRVNLQVNQHLLVLEFLVRVTLVNR